MKQLHLLLLRLAIFSILMMSTAVVYAQDTQIGRAVTREDWQDRFPALGLIVVFTLTVTGVFFFYAYRNLRRTAPHN